MIPHTCPTCKGLKKIELGKLCPTCDGTGVVWENENQEAILRKVRRDTNVQINRNN